MNLVIQLIEWLCSQITDLLPLISPIFDEIEIKQYFPEIIAQQSFDNILANQDQSLTK